MGRFRGANGQFLKTAEVEAGLKEGEPVPEVPVDCRERALKEIQRSLPRMIRALVDKALEGSAPHAKLLLQLERELSQMAGEERGKGLEEILLERWKRDGSVAVGEGENAER